MQQLYYCRHGESFINVQNVFATRAGTAHDLGLTDIGKQQAEACGVQAVHAGMSFDTILSSPLVRAQETAEIIARHLGYDKSAIETFDELIEIQYGELQGTPWSAFWDQGYTYADLGKFAGAETIQNMHQRAIKAMDIISQRPEQSILIVSHSGFGRALKRVIDKKPYTDELINNISLPHAEIMRLI